MYIKNKIHKIYIIADIINSWYIIWNSISISFYIVQIFKYKYN